ncbi:MAG: radical SAM protein [Vulcanisaeta sp.]|uniref:radical SAM protein n=1 Tax=Vulcanisaeta sp. TaxID=2020871 RepID=UPI003D10D581
MINFSRLWIWRHIRDKLPWYYEVATNKKPAKYLIAARVPVNEKLTELSEDELWREFDRALNDFLELWRRVKYNEVDIRNMPKASPSLLDLTAEITRRMIRHCEFCEWRCRVDRMGGKRLGVCMLDSTSRVSTYFHHLGEELPLRGVMGSGTIFFTSCNFRCAFCQNADISRDRFNGVVMNPRQIASAAVILRLEGVHNINWVGGEPTPHLHNIVEAIRLIANQGIKVLEGLSNEEYDAVLSVKADFIPYNFSRDWASYGNELNVPMLWNSNFYMTVETTKLLRVLMDIWLPDFKYGNNKCAFRISRVPRYFEVVSRNHKLVYDWGEDMIIRHLVMPGHVEDDSKPVLKWIADNMPGVLVNIMDQYRPENETDPDSPRFNPEFRELARRPSKEELMEVYRYARDLGLNFELISFEKKMDIRYLGDEDSLIERINDT